MADMVTHEEIFDRGTLYSLFKQKRRVWLVKETAIGL